MSLQLSVASLPKQNYAFTNAVYLNDSDFQSIRNGSPLAAAEFDGEVKAYGVPVMVGTWVFSARVVDSIEKGQLGVNGLQRRTAALSLDQVITVQPFIVPAEGIALATLNIEVAPLRNSARAEVIDIDCNALADRLKTAFLHQVFAVNQQFCVEFEGPAYALKVTSVAMAAMSGATSSSSTSTRGQLLKLTEVQFTKKKDAAVKLTGQGSSTGAKIFRPDFDFGKLGIGGLDTEFGDIFRRAFASRVYPPSLLKQMGMDHVRGLLLYGPPGCGKTLIARKIGQVLNAREPKIVNGPEILNKYVGQSEENIRELFKDAEEEQAEKGDDSELHIIIFDELDAICKSRGASRDGTGVGDSVVNQLLSKIDGVDSLQNILIIGMTNRKDMMDEALLRPGRFEVHIEIGLPNEHGRNQILQIHTKSMRENGLLDPSIVADYSSTDADVPPPNKLAKATKNYSGAEIAGLIRNAMSHALNRGVDPTKFTTADLKAFKPQLKMEDIELALSNTKPNFGVDGEELTAHFRNGIVHYGTEFERLYSTMQQLVNQVRTSDRTPLMSVLLEGPAQTGKTALAAKIAAESGFPFVRVLTPDKLIGYSDNSKCNHVFKMFQDAYKSPLSMIIIDDIERCLGYTPIGPRFSLEVLQALLVLIKKNPPVEGRKLMIIGTTSVAHLLDDMELTGMFNVALHVPKLSTPDEIKAVLKSMDIGDEVDTIAANMKQEIGVKKLLMITEMARQNSETDNVSADRFMECVINCGV